MRRPIVLVLLCLAAACGTTETALPDAAVPRDDGPPAPLAGLVAIDLQPADATLELVNGTPVTQRYTAAGSFSDGSHADVTGDVVFTLDDSLLGSFDGPELTSTSTGGTTNVHATNGAVVGTTTLTLATVTAVFGAGVPPDAPGLFAAAAGGGPAPAIVYPPDGVLMPPNLTLVDIQFTPGAGQDLFELDITGATYALRLYATCTAVGGGCSVVPDPATWQLIASAFAGQGPFTLTVRGLAQAAAQLGVSAPISINIGEAEVNGGIYYWNAKGSSGSTGGSGVVMRYDFGVPTPLGEEYYTGADGGGICVGCHVLSPKGTRAAIGMGAPTQVSTLRVIDVATKSLFFGLGTPGLGGGSNFQAFSPDETELITSNGGSLVLHDSTTGAVKDPNPLVALGTMADFAPDNSAIVFARPAASPCIGNMCQPGITKAGLVLLARTGNGTSWGGETQLVPQSGTENNYYPAFSPDGEWVLYNFSPATMSYDAADARVRVVPAAGGMPIDLTTANLNGGNSWPKWGPYVQSYRGGKIMWLTFSSRRAYGLYGAANAQLWMAAFDPARAAAGDDPSYPAFWLPFQDPATGNHIAQWVPTVVRQPCSTTNDCGASEMCENSECVPIIQ